MNQLLAWIPVAGADLNHIARFDRKVQRYFFSSHILSEVEAVSDRVLWIEKGRIIEGNELMWTIQCIVERPDVSVVTTLQSIEGVSSVHIEGNCDHAHLPPQGASENSSVSCRTWSARNAETTMNIRLVQVIAKWTLPLSSFVLGQAGSLSLGLHC